MKERVAPSTSKDVDFKKINGVKITLLMTYV